MFKLRGVHWKNAVTTQAHTSVFKKGSVTLKQQLSLFHLKTDFCTTAHIWSVMGPTARLSTGSQTTSALKVRVYVLTTACQMLEQLQNLQTCSWNFPQSDMQPCFPLWAASCAEVMQQPKLWTLLLWLFSFLPLFMWNTVIPSSWDLFFLKYLNKIAFLFMTAYFSPSHLRVLSAGTTINTIDVRLGSTTRHTEFWLSVNWH